MHVVISYDLFSNISYPTMFLSLKVNTKIKSKIWLDTKQYISWLQVVPKINSELKGIEEIQTNLAAAGSWTNYQFNREEKKNSRIKLLSQKINK